MTLSTLETITGGGDSGGGGGAVDWPLQGVGNDAYIMLQERNDEDHGLTWLSPGMMMLGDNGSAVEMSTYTNELNINGLLGISGLGYRARWLGGTTGVPTVDLGPDGFRASDFAVDRGGSIWINTADDQAPPAWVEVGAGGGAGGDYVELAGGAMTGMLTVAPYLASGYNAISATPTAPPGGSTMAAVQAQFIVQPGTTVSSVTAIKATGPYGPGATINNAIGLEIESQSNGVGYGIAIRQVGSQDVNSFAGRLELGEGSNIQVGTSAGTMIGTQWNQKLGFWGNTPISRQNTLPAATDPASTMALVNDMRDKFFTLGLFGS